MAKAQFWKNFQLYFRANPYRAHFQADHRERLKHHLIDAEQAHLGEIRLVIETQLPLAFVLQKKEVRQRAIQWFSDLHVWDTGHNTGIVLYLLLAEKKIEIVADRGIAQFVQQDEWQTICAKLQQKMAADLVVDGLCEALTELGDLLRQHFPLQENSENPDELSNELIFIP